MELPESALPHCIICNGRIQPGGRVIYEVTGFEKERSQGGANQIIARKRTGRVVGSCCAHRVQRGEPIEQGRLL